MTTYNEEIANSPEGWVASFEIMAKYMANGMKTKFFLEASHDLIYTNITLDDLPEDSDDGKALIELGWYADSELDVWGYFT